MFSHLKTVFLFNILSYGSCRMIVNVRGNAICIVIKTCKVLSDVDSVLNKPRL